MTKNKQFYECYYKKIINDPIENLKQYSRINKISQMFPNNKNSCIFVGCGYGKELDILKNKKNLKIVIGIDLSQNALKIAKNYNPDHSFIASNANFLPFKNNSFDIVICSELIEHLENPELLLDEINRIIKKEGIFILTTSNWYSFYGVFRYIGEKIFRKQLTAGDQPIDHWYTPNKIKRQLQNYFKIENVTGSWYFPPFGKGGKKIPNSFVVYFINKFEEINNKMSEVFPNFGHIIIIKAIANKKH